TAAAARETATGLGVTDRFIDRHARFTVSANPAAGVIRITARAHSTLAAEVMAEAAAQQTETVAGRLAPGGGGPRLVIGDFEDGPGDWIAPSMFNNPPATRGLTRSTARYNRTS